MPLISALGVFILGIVIASLLRRLWQEIARLINFEKSLLIFNNYKALVKFDKNVSLTEVVSLLIWWDTILVFGIVSLELLGIKVTSIFSSYFSLIPNFIISTTILLVGFLIAYFAYLFIGGVGALVSFPAFLWVARLSALSIIVTSLIFTLKSLGISEEMLRFIEIATIAASALAAGLGGRDLALDLVKKVRNLVK